LACHLLDYGQARFEEDETALADSLFENFVAMELVKQATWAETSVRNHHLRTAGGREVRDTLFSRERRYERDALVVPDSDSANC